MPSISLPPPPAFKHLLGDDSHLEQLRESVTPILSNRILTHFTDHSVTHSDNIINLVDQIIEPLQSSEYLLNHNELTVLYSAAYLHDIGMHYENAGETKIIQSLGLLVAWPVLQENERRELLRKYHHVISAEMIMKSVRAKNPVVGIQMTERYLPDSVAAISEAHNMPVDSERYRELTADVGNIRMGLISGLLRLADILDESHRRAAIEQARTLQLDLGSQTHWWRHYYTKDIKIDQNDKLITIWFDFPTEKHTEYSSVVPQLQMPSIEAEFHYHASTFQRFGFGWTVNYVAPIKAYSGSDSMPDAVLGEMWKQISQRQAREIEDRRGETLQQFRRSLPFFDRRVAELEQKKGTISAGEYLRKALEISRDLSDLGGKRSANELLSSAYHDDGLQELGVVERIEAGIQLATMLNSAGDARRSMNLLVSLRDTVDSIVEGFGIKFLYWRTLASILSSMFIYSEAITAYTWAINFAPHDSARKELEAEIAELHLFFGEYESLLAISDE